MSVSCRTELRKQNCGTTDYDIYQKPPEQCNPNTAIPGTSIHVRGVAIDFKLTGAGGTNSTEHRWLRTYGPAYGFYWTVDTEPWHVDTQQKLIA